MWQSSKPERILLAGNGNPAVGRRKCRRTQRVMRDGNIDRRTLLRLLAGTAGAAAMSIAPEVFAQQRAKAPLKPRLVVLDPGHGGVDPGAIGRTGTYEKDGALATPREVARQLEASRRYRLRLPRNHDKLIPLPHRRTRAPPPPPAPFPSN